MSDDASAVFLQVLTEIRSTTDGDEWIPSPDAEEFYQFAQRVEALLSGTTYQLEMSFSDVEASGAALLSGKVTMMPVLEIRTLGTEDSETLARLIYEYAKSNGCVRQ